MPGRWNGRRRRAPVSSLHSNGPRLQPPPHLPIASQWPATSTESTLAPVRSNQPPPHPRRTAEGRTERRHADASGSRGADARRRRDAAAHALSVARSLHARPHERRAVLCGTGRDRRRHGGRHGRPGRHLEGRGIRRGRSRPLPQWLAGLRRLERRGRAEARRGSCPPLLRPRHPRHAGLHRLGGAHADRQAEGRRDAGRRRRHRPGRRHGRPDRQADGLPRRRHRRRAGEMRPSHRHARLRRRHRPQGRRVRAKR